MYSEVVTKLLPDRLDDEGGHRDAVRPSVHMVAAALCKMHMLCMYRCISCAVGTWTRRPETFRGFGPKRGITLDARKKFNIIHTQKRKIKRSPNEYQWKLKRIREESKSSSQHTHKEIRKESY